MAEQLPVTGSSARPDLSLAVIVGVGGIGMATARRLGQHHRLLLTDFDRDRLEARCHQLCEEGFDAAAHPCDITDAGQAAELAAQVERRGPLGALAHVAALSPSMGSAQRILTVNLVGARHVEQAMRHLARKGTAAVFVSSLAAQFAAPSAKVMAILDDALAPGFFRELEEAHGEMSTAEAYTLAKFALNRMCRRMAAAWGQQGARILSVSPGLIATPMGALEFRNQPNKYEILSKIPAGREGTMVEIANAIEFFASPRASYISGVDILVDGGVAAALAFPDN